MPTSHRLDGLRAAFARVGLPAWFVAIDPLVGGQARRFRDRCATLSTGRHGVARRSESVGGRGARLPLRRRTTHASAVRPDEPASARTVDRPLAHRRCCRLDMARPATCAPALVGAVPAACPRDLERQSADRHAGATRARDPFGRRPRGDRQAICAVAVSVPSQSPDLRDRVLAITLLVLPWQLYVEHGLRIGTHVATAWNGSAWRFPILVPPTLIGVVGVAAERRGVVQRPCDLAGDPVLLRFDRTPGPGRQACDCRPAGASGAAVDASRRDRTCDRTMGQGAPRATQSRLPQAPAGSTPT